MISFSEGGPYGLAGTELAATGADLVGTDTVAIEAADSRLLGLGVGTRSPFASVPKSLDGEGTEMEEVS